MSVAGFKPNFWLRLLANGCYGLEFVGFVDITGGMEGARVLFGCFALSADPVAETLLVGSRLEGFEPTAGLGRGVATGVGLASAAALDVAFSEIADFGFSAFFIPRVAAALGFTFVGALAVTLGLSTTKVFVFSFSALETTDLVAASGLAGIFCSAFTLAKAADFGSTFSLAEITGLAGGTAFGFVESFGFVEIVGLVATTVFSADLLDVVGTLTASDALTCNAR